MSAAEIIKELPKLTESERRSVLDSLLTLTKQRSQLKDPATEYRAVDLRERGIKETQAADLRARLKTFAGDWNRPEAAIYDKFPLALPPLPEQQEIVRRVEGLFALADQLEVRLAKARGNQVKKFDTSPSILSPFAAERKILACKWTYSPPARSGCALSLREIALTLSQRVQIAGKLVPMAPAEKPASALLGPMTVQPENGRSETTDDTDRNNFN